MAGTTSEKRPSAPQRERLLFPAKNTTRATSIRFVALSILVAYYAEKAFKISRTLFPWGRPMELIKPFEYALIDRTNDLLQTKHGKTKKIVERNEGDITQKLLDAGGGLVKGPETVVFDPNGTLYLMTSDAKLVKLTDFQDSKDDPNTITAKATFVRNLGIGRPLGGKFTPDGQTLYIADALMGLVRIRNPEDPLSKLEVVVSHVDDGDEKRSPILFADDVAISPKSGKVYFSDASNIPPDRIPGSIEYDPMYASKLDALRGGPGTGRIIEYDPNTDKTKVLARNIQFANGVAVDKDGAFLLFAETFGVKLYKYHLGGDKKGALEVVVPSKELPAYLDGVDCSWTTSGPSSGKCYAVMPSAILSLVKLLHAAPDSVSTLLRSLFMMLPRHLAPETDKFAAILELDPATNDFRLIQDPSGVDLNDMTGVTEHDNRLYLASLHHNFIGVYNLED